MCEIRNKFDILRTAELRQKPAPCVTKSAIDENLSAHFYLDNRQTNST